MKRLPRKHIITLTIVIGVFTGLKAADIHPNTYSLGQREDGKIHAWVFLSHKASTLGKAQQSIAVSAKAQERRQRRGKISQAQIFQLDQPVSEDFLQQLQRCGVDMRCESRWLNAVSISATREQLEEVTKLPFVTRVEPVRQMIMQPPEPTLIPMEKVSAHDGVTTKELFYGPSYQQLALLNVPAVHDLGYSGKGITILVLDTGYFKDHESIRPERIISEYDFLNDDSETQNETREDTLAGQEDHGTATYTALGGYSPGKLIGPSYNCYFLLAKTEYKDLEESIEEDYYVAGLEWGEAQGADIVSSSLGYLDWYDYEDMDGQTAVTTIAVTQAARLGMLVVTAAGNERNNTDWGGYIIAPGDADSIITVGAVDKGGTLAIFSSHGPTSDGRIKPEVVAPGVSVYCASPTGTANYTYINGTSMATPLVAGSAALLLEAHPNWGPEDVIAAMLATASRANQPDSVDGYGWGIPNVLAALNYNNSSSAMLTTLEITTTYPNPYRILNNNIAIRWIVKESSPVSLDVYNLLGQHIINLCRRETAVNGPYISYWTGIDYRGIEVPSGIYILRLTAGQDAKSRRITIIR